MIQFGTEITQPGDELKKITLDRLYLGISKPKQAFVDRIQQLRTIAGVDPEQYKQLKKQLPYFVCGIFHPAIRRKAHFAAIQYFVIDLDHLGSAAINQLVLRSKLKEDPRVVLLFESPGGDGMKIMFQLDQRCSDEALFSAFYKLFAAQLAHQYELQSVIDYNTSDVTRACFLSYDPAAYFNPTAQTITIAELIPLLDFDSIKKEVKAIEQIGKKSTREQVVVNSPSENKEVLDRIKAKLNPKPGRPTAKAPTVPPQIHEALIYIKENITEYGLDLIKTTPIHYGHQLRISTGNIWAELNLFYGQKKGYTIVKTTKTGSNEELTELAAQVVYELIIKIENQG